MSHDHMIIGLHELANKVLSKCCNDQKSRPQIINIKMTLNLQELDDVEPVNVGADVEEIEIHEVEDHEVEDNDRADTEDDDIDEPPQLQPGEPGIDEVRNHISFTKRSLSF